jgi:hypothetical protein
MQLQVSPISIDAAIAARFVLVIKKQFFEGVHRRAQQSQE